MGQLAVLAVSPLKQGLISAQILLGKGPTELRCGHTYSEAAAFLYQYPGTLVMCERSSSDSDWSDVVAHLLAEGCASALLLVTDSSEDRVSVEVRLLGCDDVLREFFQNVEVMRKIDAAWRYCKAANSESVAVDQRSIGYRVM